MGAPRSSGRVLDRSWFCRTWERIESKQPRMWTLWLQVVFICVYLQVRGCYPSCIIVGSVASCAGQRLRSVPPLPRHITHLYLQMNRIAQINASSLRGLEDLQELDLGRQLVPLVVRSGAFGGQRHLRRLVLGFNVGLRLEPRAFEGLSALRDLHLDYCSLDGSILEEDYLEPLSSLQTLDLFGNQIQRLRPAPFFTNMTTLRVLDLKLNRISKVCESDLVGLQGKHFSLLSLNSVHLKEMSRDSFDWPQCGSPFRGISFGTLDLSYTGLSVAQTEKFFRAIEGTKISHLKLSGHLGKGFSFNNLPDPDRWTFEGLRNSSLLSLDLSKNKIFALQHGVFSPLNDVSIIDVSRNSLNQIHRNAFQGLQGHLRMLNLSHNLLGEVYSHTFASLTNLRVLDLSYNHIGALAYGSFAGLLHLKGLYLTGNSLRDLGFPAALPSLTHLMLNDNKLRDALGVSRFARNVVHVDLQDNRLTTLGDVHPSVTPLKHLQHLLVGGNPIRRCPVSRDTGSNGLQVLDLHGSSLQSLWAQTGCLNLLQDLGGLTALNLSSNALQSLPQGVFKRLGSLVELDLSSNALTHLGPDELPATLKVLYLADNFIASPDPAALRPLAVLDLGMNRFHCNADLSRFLTWLNGTDVTLLSPAEELRCQFPFRFQGVPLLDYSARVTEL